MTIWPLLESLLLTLAVYVCVAISKRNVKPISYVIIFIIAFLGAIVFGSSLHAEIPDAKIEIKQIQFYLNNLQTKLSREDKKFYQDKIRFHMSNGNRCYNDVKNKCAWLPGIDDRDTAKFCLVTAGTLITPMDPLSKLMAVTVELFIYMV